MTKKISKNNNAKTKSEIFPKISQLTKKFNLEGIIFK